MPTDPLNPVIPQRPVDANVELLSRLPKDRVDVFLSGRSNRELDHDCVSETVCSIGSIFSWRHRRQFSRRERASALWKRAMWTASVVALVAAVIALALLQSSAGR